MLKKSIAIPVLTFVLGVIISGFLVNRISLDSIEEETQKPLYWVAPMDASYRKDGPGKSPMGMDLVPVYETAKTESVPVGTVTISSQIESELGVRTAKVKSQIMRQDLNVAGFLQYDDTSVQHYHSRTNGWVEKLYVYSVGDKIQKGDKLYDLYSPELVYGQEEFIAALNTVNHSLLQSSRLKLQALGVSTQQINELQKNKTVKQRLTFYAKKSGYVSHLNVREGMYVQPQVEMLASADLSSIWVIAEVFESQSAWLELGLPVTMSVKAFADKRWQGKVDYIFPNMNAVNRTQQVRVVFDNADLLLKPNMFAQLSIETKPTLPRLTVPDNAIILTGSGERVVLALGSGKFRSVSVTTGLQAQGVTEILSGLKAGQSIVTSAQFLIDSESNVSAELNRIDADSNTMTTNLPSAMDQTMVHDHHEMENHHD
jgi:Cu(I)/Ag(I) efflux system membrane fusion protein